MNKKITLGLLLLTVVAIVGVPGALAWEAYVTPLNDLYGPGLSCGACHVNPNGGGARNDYGKLFEAEANHQSDPTAALQAIGAPPGSTPPPPADNPPVVTITSPTDGQTFTTDAITVSGTASDDVGVSKVEVKVGAGGSYAAATGNTSWSADVTLASGSNTIYARATDTSGNTTETSVTVNYNLQTPLPDTPPSTAIKVTFTVIDNETGLPIAGAKVSMNGSKIKTDDTGTATFTNVVPGDYKYKVRAEEYEKSKDSISVTGDITVTVKLVPETEEDEDFEDGTHKEVHRLKNIFEKNPCTGFTAGIRNDEHSGQDEQDEE